MVNHPLPPLGTGLHVCGTFPLFTLFLNSQSPFTSRRLSFCALKLSQTFRLKTIYFISRNPKFSIAVERSLPYHSFADVRFRELDRGQNFPLIRSEHSNDLLKAYLGENFSVLLWSLSGSLHGEDSSHENKQSHAVCHSMWCLYKAPNLRRTLKCDEHPSQ